MRVISKIKTCSKLRQEFQKIRILWSVFLWYVKINTIEKLKMPFSRVIVKTVSYKVAKFCCNRNENCHSKFKWQILLRTIRTIMIFIYLSDVFVEKKYTKIKLKPFFAFYKQRKSSGQYEEPWLINDRFYTDTILIFKAIFHSNVNL